MPENYYDEDLDQPIAAPDNTDNKDDYGESFLAPKSAFAGKNLEVGAIHKVRIEAMHDSELELRCIKSNGRDEPEMAEESDELYE